MGKGRPRPEGPELRRVDKATASPAQKRLLPPGSAPGRRRRRGDAPGQVRGAGGRTHDGLGPEEAAAAEGQCGAAPSPARRPAPSWPPARSRVGSGLVLCSGPAQTSGEQERRPLRCSNAWATGDQRFSGGSSCFFGLNALEEMKPSVMYQQLKILYHPEDLRLAQQPSLAPAKDFHCILVMAILGTTLVAGLLVHTFLLPFHGLAGTGNMTAASSLDTPCRDPCSIVLVESIPEGVIYEDNSTTSPSTFEAWRKLLADARSTVDIVAFYWSLRNEDTHTQDPSASQGEEILAELLKLSKRGITARIAVNPPSSRLPSMDLQELQESGAQIRKVDLPMLTGGVLHTKFWIVDQTHIYLGSANMDWRALTQVKELGVAVYNCSCLARDLGKMFEVYWALGLPNATIPSPWPDNYSTSYNKELPLGLKLNGTDAGVYLSSSPPALCATGRTKDLQSVLSVIDGAREFVYVAVMSYLPTMEFSHPRRFWPVIDDHLRKVAYERRVHVRLLVGCWKHSKAIMFPFLRSLAAMQDSRTHYSVGVRLFVIPANETQAKIPYARVNHNKYMVSDQAAYIGTSNWSGDYFLHTAGAALVVNQSRVEAGGQPTIRDQLQAVFERDWNSPYSHELNLLGQWEDLCGAH